MTQGSFFFSVFSLAVLFPALNLELSLVRVLSATQSSGQIAVHKLPDVNSSWYPKGLQGTGEDTGQSWPAPWLTPAADSWITIPNQVSPASTCRVPVPVYYRRCEGWLMRRCVTQGAGTHLGPQVIFGLPKEARSPPLCTSLVDQRQYGWKSFPFGFWEFCG